MTLKSIVRTILGSSSLTLLTAVLVAVGNEHLLAQNAPAQAASPAPAAAVPKRQASTGFDWGNMDDTPDYSYTQTVYTAANAPKAPAVGDLPTLDRITQYGITWTFDRQVPVGRFITGDYYVVGPVKVTMIDPKPLRGNEVKDVATSGMMNEKGLSKTLTRHGSILNYPADQHCGFDSRMNRTCYDDKMFTPLPITMNPGDSLVSSISYDHAFIGQVGSGNYTDDDRMVKVAAVLTCLEKPVPADAFRPSFCDTAHSKIYLARDLHRELLYKLPVPEPSPNLEGSIRQYARPWIDLSMYGYANPARNLPRYGQDITVSTSTVTMMLHLDYPTEQKEKLLVNFVQRGIDLLGAIRGGYPGWQGHGGYGQGRKWALIFTGLMLGEDQMMQPHKYYKVYFGEDQDTHWGRGWNGANVVFISHPLYYGESEELLHPTQWAQTRNESYRKENSSAWWAGECLSAYLMRAEDLWGHPPFFAYVERWMRDDFLRDTHESSGTRGGRQWKEVARLTPFQRVLWEKYRKNLPPAIGQPRTPVAPPAEKPASTEGLVTPTSVGTRLDAQFGKNGVVVHHGAGVGKSFDAATGMAMAADGKIVVCGWSDGAGTTADFGVTDMALWRLNADGSLDASFNHVGYVTHDNAAGGKGRDAAEDVVIDAAGKIVVCGWSYNEKRERCMVVWRYNADGTIDTAFGGGKGFVTDRNAAGGDFCDGANTLLIGKDGKIVVAGYSSSAANGYEATLWRLNADGTFDETFGNKGRLVCEKTVAGEGLALDDEGRIVMCGIVRQPNADASSSDVAIWRILPDGKFDPSFGTNGLVTVDQGGRQRFTDQGFSVLLDKEKRIVVAGIICSDKAVSDMALWRLGVDGKLDTTFGKGGVVVHGAAAGGKSYESNGNHDAARKVLLDAEGRILVAGFSINESNNSDVVVWRYSAAGQLDKSFSPTGFVVHGNAAGGNGCDRAASMALDAKGNIVVCGFSARPEWDYDMFVLRLVPAQGQ